MYFSQGSHDHDLRLDMAACVVMILEGALVLTVSIESANNDSYF